MISLLAIACSTTNADRSYEMAKTGNYDITFNCIASKEALKDATVKALSAKHWEAKVEGDAVRANIDHRGINAHLYFTFENDTVNINSKGSTARGRPIVPLNIIEYMKRAIRKQLIKEEKISVAPQPKVEATK